VRIALDLQSCQSGSRRGGIGRYSLALVKAMLKTSPKHEYIIVLNNNFPESANKIRFELRDLLPPINIVQFKTPLGCASANCNMQLTRAAEILREQFLMALNPDVVHLTSLFEGLHEDIVTSVNVLPGSPPTAVTLYDLIPLKQSKLYLTDHRARSHYFSKIRYLENASSLLAISQYSADEATEELSKYRGPIINIKGGIDDQFRVQHLSLEIVEKLKKKYALDRGIVLYTASFDPRKNQSGLIRAFARLPLSIRNEYQLVFIGESSAETFESLTAYGISVGLARQDLRFLGRVPDTELVQFYNICDLFVFPSKWEGLGLPVLEAMSCNAPVIASGTTSISEAVGYEEALFDPHDIDSIAAKMEQSLRDSTFRADLKAHGVRHVQEYTWERTAERALSALAATVVSARQGFRTPSTSTSTCCHDGVEYALRGNVEIKELLEDQVLDVSYCGAVNEAQISEPKNGPLRKIGWITTWGTRCGIASYARNLLDTGAFNAIVFAPYADEIFDDGDYPVIRCWRQGKGDDLLELSKAVEREDPTDLFIQFNYGLFQFQAFNTFIHRQVWNGRKVFITLHSTTDQANDPSFKLAYIRRALSQASALFVHSYADVQRLAEIGLKDNVILVPHGVRSYGYPCEMMAKRRKTIATYGFFLPGKGLLEIVDALALVLNRGLDIELLMVNAEYPDPEGLSRDLIAAVEDRILELDIVEKVTLITDYLSDWRSIELLRSADLIVFPYQRTGESASGAVRMGLVSGRPVAVTPIPIFDDVRDAVFSLRGCTPEEIADSLIETLERIDYDRQSMSATLSAAERWRIVNDINNIGKFLGCSIARLGEAEMWEVCLEPELETLPVVNGWACSTHIESTGAGVVVHGPYATLRSGLYRAIVYGALDAVNGMARLRLTAGGGEFELAEIQLSQLNEQVLADLTFFSSEELDLVELVFLVENNASLRINGYEIYRRRA
jgi:glycosyltransferase involved in cell wall biosynthesis